MGGDDSDELETIIKNFIPVHACDRGKPTKADSVVASKMKSLLLDAAKRNGGTVLLPDALTEDPDLFVNRGNTH